MEWIAPHMGTDVALMLGIAHTAGGEWLAGRRVSCPLRQRLRDFARYLTGESDGVAKTADWAAAICGVAADEDPPNWRNFSTENTTMLMAGWGMQRQQYGEQKHWMLVTTGCDAGADWHPRAGLVFLPFRQRRQSDPPRGSAGSSMQGAWPEAWTPWKIPVARIVEALENRGRSISTTAWRGASRYSLYLVVPAAPAPSSGYQPPDSGLAKPENLSSSPNASGPPPRVAADIVLPATTSFERNDLTMTGDYSNQHLVPMKQVVARQVKRDDFAVFADLSERCIT